MACKEDFKKKCESKPLTKQGYGYKASWNESKKTCECMINKTTTDAKGKVIDSEYIHPSRTR